MTMIFILSERRLARFGPLNEGIICCIRRELCDFRCQPRIELRFFRRSTLARDLRSNFESELKPFLE